MKKIMCFTISILIILSGFIYAEAQTVSGQCEDGALWSIDDDGILTITSENGLSSVNISHWYSKRDIVKAIVINGSPNYIGENCFSGLLNVTSVSIPETVETIGYKAFADCTSLQSIYLPYCISELDNSFCDGCTSLKSIFIPDRNSTFCSENGVLYSKDKTILYRYPPAKVGESFIVPDSVTLIYGNAFESNCRLNSITVGEGVIMDKSQLPPDITVVYTENELPQHITHEYISTVYPPSCFEEGYTNHKCILCGYEYNDSYKNKLEHITETDNAITATCTRVGMTQGSHCVLCGTVIIKQEEIPVKEHVFSNGICIACGYHESAVNINTDSAASSSVQSVNKPAKAKIKKITGIKKGFTLNWKKQSGVKGYQIQYCTNSKFTKSKHTITIKSKNTTSKTIKKLKSSKAYYVRIRAYSVVNSKKCYGKWSDTKKVITK